jgi:hypothetical protein
MAEHEVKLHVYDLSGGMARTMSQTFLGIQIDIVPHTGIVCFGKEFFYSGGIQSLPPDSFGKMYLPPCQVLTLGTTEIPAEVFDEFLAGIAEDFTADKYNLMRHNCNHFTEECSTFLLGVSIPAFIRELPDKVMATPMGAVFSQMFEASANSFDPLAQQGASAAAPSGGGGGGGGGGATGLDVMAALSQALPQPPPASQSAATLAAAAMQTSPRQAPPQTPAAAMTASQPAPMPPTPAAPAVTIRGGAGLQMPPTPAATPAASSLMSPPAQTPATRPLPRPPVSAAAAPPHSVSAPNLVTPSATAPRPRANGGAGGRGSEAPPSSAQRAAATSAAGNASSTPAIITPVVTPAAAYTRAPHLFPGRQPLISAGGPTGGVLKLIGDALRQATDAAAPASASAEPPASAGLGDLLDARSFEESLRAALDDPNLVMPDAAARLSVGFVTLLGRWRPPEQKHFALLYLLRLLVAASDTFAAALLDTTLIALLIQPDGGVLGGRLDHESQPVAAARGARLMALALLANLAAKPARARRLLGGASAAAVAAAAARALGAATSDAALAQMGGALALNLALQLVATPEDDTQEEGWDDGEEVSVARVGAAMATTEQVMPTLLPAALGALPMTQDAEAFGRALSCVGHLLSAGEADEATAIAISLDGAATLKGLAERAASLGHADLIAEVSGLILM